MHAYVQLTIEIGTKIDQVTITCNICQSRYYHINVFWGIVLTFKLQPALVFAVYSNKKININITIYSNKK